jgi:hypothetical protein
VGRVKVPLVRKVSVIRKVEAPPVWLVAISTLLMSTFAVPLTEPAAVSVSAMSAYAAVVLIAAEPLVVMPLMPVQVPVSAAVPML